MINSILNMLFCPFRVLAGNPNVSEKSLHNILERGVVRVEGGVSLFGLLSLFVLLFFKWRSLLELLHCATLLLTRLFVLSPAGVMFSRDFRINLVGLKGLLILCLYLFVQVCHNKSAVLCFAISEKHCEAQYGSDCRHAVKDKIPCSSCPVRMLTPSHNIQFKFIYMQSSVLDFSERKMESVNNTTNYTSINQPSCRATEREM